jgi:hypothetical protein
MYLDKKGCEFYRAIFEGLAKSGERLGDGDRYLQELEKHVHNIKEHREGDSHIIKKFINTVSMKMMNDKQVEFIDPRISKLSEILQHDIRIIDQKFDELGKNITAAIKNINNESKNIDSNGIDQDKKKIMESGYGAIAYVLKEIRNVSEDIAKSLRTILITVELDKEYIKNQEQAVTDFEKNFMSWFN